MNLQDFMEKVRELDEISHGILFTANDEYSKKENLFSNFEVTAMIVREINPRLQDIRSEDIALVFAIKHFISIGKEVTKREPMENRYADLINYIRLHYGLYLQGNETGEESTIT